MRKLEQVKEQKEHKISSKIIGLIFVMCTASRTLKNGPVLSIIRNKFNEFLRLNTEESKHGPCEGYQYFNSKTTHCENVFCLGQKSSSIAVAFYSSIDHLTEKKAFFSSNKIQEILNTIR